MIKQYIIGAAVVMLACLAWGKYQYHIAWDAGRADLAQWYKAKAEAQQAKATTQIQKDEVKAVESKAKSDKQFEVIERDTIKYITRPSPGGVKFDDTRVRIKAAAVEAAGNIPGFDDATSEAASAEQRPGRRSAY